MRRRILELPGQDKIGRVVVWRAEGFNLPSQVVVVASTILSHDNTDRVNTKQRERFCAGLSTPFLRRLGTYEAQNIRERA